jgi:hypothetical protein
MKGSQIDIKLSGIAPTFEQKNKMKTKIKFGIATLTVMLAMVLKSCDRDDSSLPGHRESPVFKQAYFPSGFTQGEVNENVRIRVEFSHPDAYYQVQEIRKVVIDDFLTEYTIVAVQIATPRDSAEESIEVEYYLSAAGVHRSAFFYKDSDSPEREELGSFSFSFNQ